MSPEYAQQLEALAETLVTPARFAGKVLLREVEQPLGPYPSHTMVEPVELPPAA